MLSFHPASIAQRAEVEALLRATNYRICECSFVDLYIWRHKYGSSICLENGFLFIRFFIDGEYYYMCPIGTGDLKAAILSLEAHCEEHGHALRFTSVTSEMIANLDAVLPGRYRFFENRDAADYIYLAEDLITLKGKKLHSKRNFVNRFINTFDGRWAFLPIDIANLDPVLEFESRWYRKNHSSEEDMLAETTAIGRLLDDIEGLGAVGGMLTVDDKLVGFSLGSQNSDDTFVVHIEKADWEVPGAYQMLNREFAKMFCSNVTYINREDDLGLEGLRKAKLSYHPFEVKMKYRGGLAAELEQASQPFVAECVSCNV